MPLRVDAREELACISANDGSRWGARGRSAVSEGVRQFHASIWALYRVWKKDGDAILTRPSPVLWRRAGAADGADREPCCRARISISPLGWLSVGRARGGGRQPEPSAPRAMGSGGAKSARIGDDRAACCWKLMVA
jgi:hypothetical protein